MRRILVVAGLTIAGLVVPAAAASASTVQHEVCVVTYQTPDASGSSRDFCVNW